MRQRQRAWLREDDPFAALKASRRRLILDTFGAPTLPTTLASSVTRNYGGPSYHQTDNSKSSRCDRYLCPAYGSWTSEAHLLYPPLSVAPVNKLAVIHGGHSITYHDPPYPGGEFTAMSNMCDAFLLAGWHVLGVCMPVAGYNGQQGLLITLPDNSTKTYTTHDFRDAEALGAKFLRYFVDPAIVALNQALADYHFAKVIGTGISGGGGTWDQLGALYDGSVVQFIAPACGSAPPSLYAPMGIGSDAGDYEQAIVLGPPAHEGPQGFWRALAAPDGIEPETWLYAVAAFDKLCIRTRVKGDTVFPAVNVVSQIAAIEAIVASLVPHGNNVERVDPALVNPLTGLVGHWYPDATIASTLAAAQAV